MKVNIVISDNNDCSNKNNTINEQNINKCSRRPSSVIHLYQERDMLMANNIKTGARNVSETVPGNTSFSSATKHGKNICVICDSHLNRIKKNFFNNSLSTGKTCLNVFRASTIKMINNFAIPTMVEDKPDVIIINVGCNDVTKQNMNIVNPSKLSDGISRNKWIVLGRFGSKFPNF